MSIFWKFYWGFVAVTLFVYGVMIFWSLPLISAAANGLVPFDMRPTGYSFDDAQAFLLALPAPETAFYLNVQQRLDLFYPALLAVVLVVGLWRLTQFLPKILRLLLTGLAVLGAMADYLENLRVAQMLLGGPELLSRELVEAANRWTIIKSGAGAIAMVALLILMSVALLGVLRNKKGTQ